jgi:hypothetical protein
VNLAAAWVYRMSRNITEESLDIWKEIAGGQRTRADEWESIYNSLESRITEVTDAWSLSLKKRHIETEMPEFFGRVIEMEIFRIIYGGEHYLVVSETILGALERWEEYMEDEGYNRLHLKDDIDIISKEDATMIFDLTGDRDGKADDVSQEGSTVSTVEQPPETSDPAQQPEAEL